MKWVLFTVLAACSASPPSDPTRLSGRGLYSDIAKKVVAKDAIPFQPRHALWSDGADKQRWIRIPKGKTIDKRDPDHWRFPVGTQVFKEFARDGRRLETRLIERIDETGDRDRDYFAAAFVWLEDESDAVLAEEGALDVLGTTHDVPAAKDCWRCHLGEPGAILGYSAIQLGEEEIAGADVEIAAAGYLHANCGHCHHSGGNAWRHTDLLLRLFASDEAVGTSKLAQTTIGVPLFRTAGLRIDPGSPETSGILQRMHLRGVMDQMPPLASEVVDADGVALVTDWVKALAR